MIEDGKNLVKREKRRIQQNDPEAISRHREVSDRLRDNYSSKAAKYQNDLGTGSASANDIKKSNILILIKKCFFFAIFK